MILALLLACSELPEADTDVLPEVTCPAEGEVGREAGLVPEDVAFTTCDGEPASLQGLCGRPALVLAWYGWCPSCETNAKLGRRLAEEHEELDVAVVLREDPVGDPVGDEFCEAYASTYPSRAQLWTDPDGLLEIYGTTDLVLVLDREGRLTLVRETSNEAVIADAVGAVTD